MNLGEITGFGILWLSAAGFSGGIAEKNGWGMWRWYLASFLTGPAAWFMLYLKLREKRETIGPINRRSQFHRRLRPGDQGRRIT